LSRLAKIITTDPRHCRRTAPGGADVSHHEKPAAKPAAKKAAPAPAKKKAAPAKKK
jgi:hypothetical protein